MRNHHVIAVLLALGGCDSGEPPPNHPPFLITSDPDVGSIMTAGPGTPVELSAVLGDENVDDNLFIRFLVDYPGLNERQALIREFVLPRSGTIDRAAIHIQPNCASATLGPGLHRLMMSVSDRPFLDVLNGQDVDPDAPLDSVPADANHLRTVWLLSCP